MTTSPMEIIRLRRSDAESEHHLLVEIARKGPKSLDLDLVATDRNSLFHIAIKEASVGTLQAANFAGDLGEWKSVLSYVLLHQRPEGPLPESLQGVEALAAVSGTTATITLRRNIGGITQKLGSISLEKDEDREIDALEWVDAAAKTSSHLRSQLDTRQESVTSLQDQIVQLTARLDSLVRAKKEHEEELLSKFAALLNAKKLKIRDQQRLLAGAQIDPNAVHHARSPNVRTTGRDTVASRKGKRKANGDPSPEEEDQDEEQTDSDTADERDEDEDRRQQLTPETEEEDNADESNGVPDGSSLAVRPSDSQTTRRVTRQSQPVSSQMDVDAAGPSGPREVPIGRRKEVAKALTPPPTSTMIDEDDETDDEL